MPERDLQPGLRNEMPPVGFGCLAALVIVMIYLFGQVILVLTAGQGPALLPALGASQLFFLLIPTLLAARYQSLPVYDLLRLKPVPMSVHATLLIGVVLLQPVLQYYLVAQELHILPHLAPGLRDALNNLTAERQKFIAGLLESRDVLTFIMLLIVVGVIPAFSEELLFRGAIQRSFERRLAPGFAILLAGLIFGIIHFDPVDLVPLTSLGLYFGYSAWASRSIYPAILGHFAFNAISIGLVYTIADPAELTGKKSTPEDLNELLPIAIVSLIGFVLVMLWFRRFARRAKESEAITVSSDTNSDTTSSTDDN